MRSIYLAALVIMVAFGSTAPSALYGQRGTFDAGDLSCGGAPVELCSGTYSASARTSNQYIEVRCADKPGIYTETLPADSGPLSTVTHSHARHQPPAEAEGRYAVAVLRFAPSEGGGGAGRSTCQRQEFNDRPLWISSAFITHDHQLVLVDATRSKIRSFSPDGAPIDRAINHADHAERASYIQPGPEGYVLLTADQRMVLLSSDMTTVSEIIDIKSASSNPRAGERRIDKLYSWVINNDTLYAFADTVDGEGQWTSGLIEAPMRRLAEFKIIVPVPLDSPYRKYYHIGHWYLAEAGDEVFFVEMGRESRLLRIARNGRQYLPVPEGYTSAPLLPLTAGPAGYVEVFYAIEKSSLIVGLVSWQESLYMIARHSLPGGGSRWRLMRIDRENGSVQQEMGLPSTAPHLSVIPGDSEWILIEKGTIQTIGRQEISGFLRIPSRLVQGGSLSAAVQCNK